MAEQGAFKARKIVSETGKVRRQIRPCTPAGTPGASRLPLLLAAAAGQLQPAGLRPESLGSGGSSEAAVNPKL